MEFNSIHTCISNVCTKTNRTIGFLRRTLFSFLQDLTEAVYKSLVRPVLEYGSLVWIPNCKGLNEKLDKVQNRTAGVVTRN